MRSIRFALFVLASLLASASEGRFEGRSEASRRLCDGFLPENSLRIPIGDHSHLGITGAGGLTQAQYNTIMDRIQKLYQGEVAKRGGTLVINRLWSDSTVNSSAEQHGGQWIINMYGGIARHPDVTFEGEALVACHEMGHHLGGAPKIDDFNGSWATNEGGADYFATLKCLRQLFASDDNAKIVSQSKIDATAKTMCQKQFPAAAAQALCLRISMASESVSYLFQDLSHEQTRPQFSTPDASQVWRTYDDHPATQCRMDTYFQGGLCTVDVSVANSDSDFKAGSCVEGVDKVGFRPRCWFYPGDTGGSSPQPDPGGGGNGGPPVPPPDPGGGGWCPLGDPKACEALCKVEPHIPYCKNIPHRSSY